MLERSYNAWVLISRAADVEGEWVAHCLDFDVVTQGRSLDHAVEMAAEAVAMVLQEDLVANIDPSHRRAPEECWAPLWRIVKSGNKTSFGEIRKDPNKYAAVAGQLLWHLVVKEATKAKRPRPKAKKAGKTWDAPLLMGRPAPVQAHAC